MKYQHILALEFGGHSIKAARVGNNGDLNSLCRFQLPEENPLSYDCFVQSLEHIISQAKEDSIIIAAGVGAPSPCDKTTLTFDLSQKHAYHNINRHTLSEIVLKSAGCDKLFVDNDAFAAARGECWRGKIPFAGKYIFATLGTGLGGCFILHGKIVKGRGIGASDSGEIWNVQYDGINLEDYCGTTKAMRTIYINACSELEEEHDQKVIEGDIEQLAIMARDTENYGLSAAFRSFSDFGGRLGKGFADIVMEYKPISIILSGGIANSFDLFKDSANVSLGDELIIRGWKEVNDIPKFMRSSLIATGGLLGAAKFAYDRIH